MRQYTGQYYGDGYLFDVRYVDGELIATTPDIPPGYEVQLLPLAADRFRIVGSDVDGAPATFIFNEDGMAIALEIGPWRLARIAALGDLPLRRQFAAPQLPLSEQAQAAFDGLIAEIDSEPTGGWLDYTLPYPLFQFLQYASALDRYIFHGSTKSDIDLFEPVRKSVEFKDHSGRGNRQATYGTQQALWAMFFAIIDRSKLRGTIRNGVATYYDRKGSPLPLYNFSINQDYLDKRPYCDGALYILPRDTFEQLELMPGVLSNEWASVAAIRPLKRLRLQPEQFPFLDSIQGHDDSELLRLGELGDEIAQAAVKAELGEDSLTLWLDRPVDLDTYIALQRIWMPTIVYSVSEDALGTRLSASALPPAVRQTLKERYRHLLPSENGDTEASDE